MITVLLLVGCNSYKDVNNNLTEDCDTQQITESNDNKQQIAESNDKKQQIAESNATTFTSQEAKIALFYALRDDTWVAENVSMKQTCFGETFTKKQNLWFEKLRDDLVIVKAYCYEDNNYGIQLFFVKYQDGNISVTSFPENLPGDPRNETYTIATGINFSERIFFPGVDYSAITDIGPLFLLKKCYNTETREFTAYKINDLSLEEVDNGICIFPYSPQYEVLNSFSGKEYYHDTTAGFKDLTTYDLLEYFQNK